MKGKKWLTKDVLCAIALIMFSLWWEWAATLIPEREFDNGLSARYMPKLLGFCLLALSLIYLAQALFKARAALSESSETKASESVKKSHLITLGLVVSLTLYCLLFKPLGFIISTFLFLFGSMSYLCRPQDGSKISLPYLLKYFLFSVVITAILYSVFGVGFKISLPTLFL